METVGTVVGSTESTLKGVPWRLKILESALGADLLPILKCQSPGRNRSPFLQY